MNYHLQAVAKLPIFHLKKLPPANFHINLPLSKDTKTPLLGPNERGDFGKRRKYDPSSSSIHPPQERDLESEDPRVHSPPLHFTTSSSTRPPQERDLHYLWSSQPYMLT